jgi:membrane protein implicated in regulation of membrane protease activity
MYIVAIAWAFIVVLMAAAEATSTQGTVLGAFITLMLYGVIPLSVVLYIMGTPMRRRARHRAEQAELARWREAAQAGTSDPGAPSGASSAQPDGRRVAPGDPVAPE